MRAVFLFAVLATFAAWVFRGVLAPLDFRLYDIGITARPAKVPENIVILGLDDRFLAGRSASFTPRDQLARLVTIAASGKPQSLALDVWLDSRFDFGPKSHDETLRAAFRGAKKSGVPVFIADLSLSEAQSGLTGVTARGSTLPFFKDASSGAGNVLAAPDPDRHVRLMPGESPIASLPFLAVGGTPELAARLKTEGAPLDFVGPPGTIPIQSAADFLDQPFLAPLLEGKIVFIGATSKGSFDFVPTPFSLLQKPPMFGVEVLAQSAAALQNGAPRLSHETSNAVFWSFLIVFGAALCVSALGQKGALPALLGAAFWTGFALVLAVWSAREPLALFAFRFQPAAPMLVAIPLCAAFSVAWRQWTQAQELKLVREAFGAYVGDEVLTQLDGKMPELGGEMRHIAVLFCDIRGYSALAEKMGDDPKRLMDELNRHFAPLVGALKDRGAYTDNYVGDLVMALFGAPVSSGDIGADTKRAVLAALDFLRLVEERNLERKKDGHDPIEVGIGVHCGEAVVGNLGVLDDARNRKIHYTAIGDVVNIASRVESATRTYNVGLLVTEEVAQFCEGDTELPALEWVAETLVKGRATPVRLYRVAN